MTLTRPSGTPRVLPLRSAAQMVVDCSRRRIGSGAGATAAATATSRPAHSGDVLFYALALVSDASGTDVELYKRWDMKSQDCI